MFARRVVAIVDPRFFNELISWVTIGLRPLSTYQRHSIISENSDLPWRTVSACVISQGLPVSANPTQVSSKLLSLLISIPIRWVRVLYLGWSRIIRRWCMFEVGKVHSQSTKSGRKQYHFKICFGMLKSNEWFSWTQLFTANQKFLRSDLNADWNYTTYWFSQCFIFNTKNSADINPTINFTFPVTHVANEL